ncbi:5'-3' exonuclease [Candidatus Schneideria nysicola]|uniref:5'-3' exonuclease n=1 Tax=Candidatus Schneideria nysicola TaxID=1081631 RepID=UPI001CAA63BD|nr:5'-3' exonuclease H3TH domain-containing protein [Candidatus Schneideria nysicola]UAJ65911.1 hypothetical protein KEC38_01935 [Candidatus Schneideria nysicola]
MIPRDNKSFIIIDGSFHLYRSYYVFSSIFSKKTHQPIGAIYGVLNTIKKILITFKPEYIAIVFDTNGKNFRSDIFSEYKLHRSRMPENLRRQINPLLNIIQKLELPILSISGVEADDVIGTLALEAEKNGLNVIISTGDKDMAQLVSRNVSLLYHNNKINSLIGPEEIQLKFGISPHFFVDYLALVGDKSDNIPGVPGIGVKTALYLLKHIGHIKRLYENLEVIPHLKKLRSAKITAKNLKKYRELAFLSYQLATIKTDVALEQQSYQAFKIKKIHTDFLHLIIQEEFNLI